MKIGNTLRSIMAGAVIYVLMAACAAAERGAPSPDAGSTTAGGSISDAVADVFARIAEEAGNPVSDARASPTAEIATETCSKSFTAAGVAFTYAEHAYPGATVSELATVVVLGTRDFGPPGYTQAQQNAWVRDGAVAVTCSSNGAVYITSATFVRP